MKVSSKSLIAKLVHQGFLILFLMNHVDQEPWVSYLDNKYGDLGCEILMRARWGTKSWYFWAANNGSVEPSCRRQECNVPSTPFGFLLSNPFAIIVFLWDWYSPSDTEKYSHWKVLTVLECLWFRLRNRRSCLLWLAGRTKGEHCPAASHQKKLEVAHESGQYSCVSWNLPTIFF